MSYTEEASLSELVSSLQNTIDDIERHPTETDKIPSNFEIMVKGVSNSKAIDALFSSNIDGLINNLFKMIESGDFEKILSKKDELEKITSTLFGQGAFKGKVSNVVLNTVSATVQSKKYNEIRSHLGKTIEILKKRNLIYKNLNKGSKHFEKNSEEYKKYKEAVYAIKQVVKFVAKIYRNRKIINRKVYNGIHNIVYEEYFDEALEG